MKHHLRRVIGTFKPTWEEMLTILCQIEACLNSRPLVRLLDSPDDKPSLTPGHFIIGTSLKSVPQRSVLNLNENLLTRWEITNKIVESFWVRWRNEYVVTLQKRDKWLRENPQIQVGDVVLLRNANSPPSYWPLARVIAVKPSRDGFVRAVTVKTAKTTLDRPITQLCKLPIGDDS